MTPTSAMAAPQTADVLIIGGSHAGLSAAATLYRHRHSCLIFDSHEARNSWATKTRATSGWEGRTAAELREASKQELLATGHVHFVDTRISKIERKNDACFRVTDAAGRTWLGRKLLVAAGKKSVFPDIEGYEENYPSSIVHCLFTFGYEYTGRPHAGILAMGFMALPHHTATVVEDARKFVDEVTVYTNGRLSELAGMEEALKPSGAAINDKPIKSFSAAKSSEDKSGSITLNFTDGTCASEAFLVGQPMTELDRELFVTQLGLELDPRGDIATKGLFYHTNVPGVFAAGDCASPLKIIPNAMLMGANAAAGIARELPRRAPEKALVWEEVTTANGGVEVAANGLS